MDYTSENRVLHPLFGGNEEVENRVLHPLFGGLEESVMMSVMRNKGIKIAESFIYGLCIDIL